MGEAKRHIQPARLRSLSTQEQGRGARSLPSSLGPSFGEPPPRAPHPHSPASGHDPWEEGSGRRRREPPPHPAQAHLPRQRRPSPPGSDRLSIQRPVARRPGSEAYPPGRSPGLDFATLPTPAADPEGREGQLSPAPEESRRLGDHRQRQPREGASPGPPSPPPASQGARSSSGRLFHLQSPRRPRSHHTSSSDGEGAGGP